MKSHSNMRASTYNRSGRRIIASAMKDRWWIHGEKRPGLRRALTGLETIHCYARCGQTPSLCLDAHGYSAGPRAIRFSPRGRLFSRSAPVKNPRVLGATSWIHPGRSSLVQFRYHFRHVSLPVAARTRAQTRCASQGDRRGGARTCSQARHLAQPARREPKRNSRNARSPISITPAHNGSRTHIASSTKPSSPPTAGPRPSQTPKSWNGSLKLNHERAAAP